MDGNSKKKYITNINTFPPDVGVLLCFFGIKIIMCVSCLGTTSTKKDWDLYILCYAVLLCSCWSKQILCRFLKNSSDKNDVNTNTIMHCKPLFILNKQTNKL